MPRRLCLHHSHCYTSPPSLCPRPVRVSMWGHTAAQEAMHVGSPRWPASANRDDLFDLRKCQTEASRLLDEVQHPDRVVIVEPVPVRGALRRRQDPLALIEADRLGGHADPAGELSDLEATIHVA